LTASTDRSDQADDGPGRAWNGFIAVAGATAGIAALAYFVGAVTIWARLRAAGLPADIAAEHYPRGEVIALGIRGIAVIAAGLAASVALVYLLLLAVTYLVPPRAQITDATSTHTRSRRSSTVAAKLREETLLDASSLAVQRLRLAHFRLFGFVGAMIVRITRDGAFMEARGCNL
jgi:lysylphosphatidylglycerol synthetase-like protein (DUF2156 family)